MWTFKGNPSPEPGPMTKGMGNGQGARPMLRDGVPGRSGVAMKRALVLSFFLLAAAVPALAAETLRYVALVDFIFKDNGRGPELKEEYELAADGTFKRYEVKGSSTFGAPVDESFVREADVGKWKSTSDAGEKTLAGTALYTPLGGTPAA